MDDQRKKSCGGIWSKKSQKGEEYLSGSIEIEGVKHRFVAFRNKYKKADNYPDYTIMPANEYKKNEQPIPQPTASDWKAQTNQTQKTATPVCDSMFGDVPDSGIPF